MLNTSWFSANASFHQRAVAAPQRRPSTYRYLMSFNHVIKLLVNLFVFFFSAWREDESRLELRALAAFVLLLAQRLAGPTIRNGRLDGGRHGQRDEGRDGWSRKGDREAESNMEKSGRGEERKGN